jgi:serine/threonine protein kinase
VMGSLDHPNIQPLFELGLDEDGRAFYTAKVIEGTRLSTILDDLHARRSNAILHYDLKRLLTIFHAVCDALAFAHSKGISHGRITADCVSIGDFGEVLVTGWEGAKRIHDQSVNAYEEDVRADIARLADLLYHILTLVPPVAGEKKPQTTPHASWEAPKGLWNMTRHIRSHRGSIDFTNIKQMQAEVEEFRQELGPRGGRAGALGIIKHRVQNWQ